MAIHQNMLQYAQKKIDVSNLNDVLAMIALVNDRLSANTMADEFLLTIVSIIIQKISKVTEPRESENIQAAKVDIHQIIEFFENIKRSSLFNNKMVPEGILNEIYRVISLDEDVSAFTCLGLSIISEHHIGVAVAHLLQANRFNNNQHKQIKNAINNLMKWQRSSVAFQVPLHVWIENVLIALHSEMHFDLLVEIALKNIKPCCLTFLVPAFHSRVLVVFRTLLEVQKCEEVLVESAVILKVLKHLENKFPVIFESVIEIYAEFVSFFPSAELSIHATYEYLDSHHRILKRSAIKQRRLTSASFLGGNVRIGLENLGNSCYINSVIQALFMAKSFCRELLTIERTDRETNTMQKIFALLLFSERSELNLKFAMSHIRPQDFMPGLQHDSSEFMGSLMDKLHEADKKFQKESGGYDGETKETEGATGTVNDSGITMESSTVEDQAMMEISMDKLVDNTSELNQSTLVQRNFGGKISTTCVCSSCKSKSISIDSFRDLALSFPEKEENWDTEAETEYSVQQLLDYYFTIEQLTLDGDNQYHCEKCKILCDGIRCTEMLQPPKNLILTLKHFRYDSRYHTRSKLLIKKMFHDETISVKVRTSHDANSKRTVQYQLHSAVVHSGVSLDSGHYYTFAREKNAVWYKFNDSYVSTSTLQELHK